MPIMKVNHPNQNLIIIVNLLLSERKRINNFHFRTETVHRKLEKWLHGTSSMPSSSTYFHCHNSLSGQDAKSAVISRVKGSPHFKRLGPNCCKFS